MRGFRFRIKVNLKAYCRSSESPTYRSVYEPLLILYVSLICPGISCHSQGSIFCL